MSIVGSVDKEDAARLLEEYAGWVDDAHGHDTPKRFLLMLNELTQCTPNQGGSPDAHEKLCIRWMDFPLDGEQDMIVVQDIPFVSVCNHHVVPFIGKAHIAYVPESKLVGLSKFARVVHHFARQLQVQERLTQQISDYLFDKLDPKGLGVVLRAEHMCMTIRGAQVPGAFTTTSSMRGVFAEHDRTAKAEFMALINGNGHK